MKKTLILALAATSFTLAGCADETPAEVDTTVIETPAVEAPMATDTTAMMGDETMMGDSTAMEGSTMEAAPATGMEAAPATGAGATADSAAAGM